MSSFKRRTRSSRVSGKNNAPGGTGGVDVDTQFELGSDNSPQGMKDRRHGICCGISATWLVGLVNEVEGSYRTSKFKEYFDNVLRFQGAYIKQSHQDVEQDLDALQGCFTHNVKKFDFQFSRATNIKSRFPTGKTKWAAYLSIWGHAIAIGRRDNSYYAMDPNLGLFVYEGGGTAETAVLDDLQEYVEKRRLKKGQAQDAQFKIWFYEKT